MHSWPSLHDRDCCLKACDLQGPNKQLSSAACNPSPVQVIENILDDDQDMEDMNLGRRAENEDKLMSVSLAVLAHKSTPSAHGPGIAEACCAADHAWKSNAPHSQQQG